MSAAWDFWGPACGKKTFEASKSILKKLDESEAPLNKSAANHLTVNQAIGAFRSVLDRRLLVPPNGAGLVYIRMQAKLKDLALTHEQCITAATQAGRQWQGNIKAQSILNQAEMLLANAESEPLPFSSSPTGYGRDDVMSEL